MVIHPLRLRNYVFEGTLKQQNLNTGKSKMIKGDDFLTKTTHATSFAERWLLIPYEIVQYTEKNLLLTTIFIYLQSNRTFRGIVRTSELELCEGCGYCYRPNENGQNLLDEIHDALNLLFQLGYIECFLDKKCYNQYANVSELPDIVATSTFNIRLSDKCLNADDRFMVLKLTDYDKIYEMRYKYRAPFMRNAFNVFCYIGCSSSGIKLEDGSWLVYFCQVGTTMVTKIPGIQSRTTLNKLLKALTDEQLLSEATLPNLRLNNGKIVKGAKIFIPYTSKADKMLPIAITAAEKSRKDYYIKQGLLTE